MFAKHIHVISLSAPRSNYYLLFIRGNAKCYKEKSYGFMPGDFQVICGSMVSENRRSPASTETPAVGDSCVVYYFQKYIYCLILKDESITIIIWRQKAFLEVQQIVMVWLGMLDYGICNMTYRLDEIERLLFELDYEVIDVTTEILWISRNR